MDTVVDPANARLLARQWCALHGLDGTTPATTEHGPARQQVWGATGAPLVEFWALPAMAHGYPVAAAGIPASAVLPAGVCATAEIARFWRLT